MPDLIIFVFPFTRRLALMPGDLAIGFASAVIVDKPGKPRAARAAMAGKGMRGTQVLPIIFCRWKDLNYSMRTQ
ncbi:hypothetical protein [Pelagibacterium halotolerans]|uniref:hypothetical protein n=1 Tax=Pelagibacterium halotolerans TaxID=531813 RepID=UPI00384E917F